MRKQIIKCCPNFWMCYTMLWCVIYHMSHPLNDVRMWRPKRDSKRADRTYPRNKSLSTWSCSCMPWNICLQAISWIDLMVPDAASRTNLSKKQQHWQRHWIQSIITSFFSFLQSHLLQYLSINLSIRITNWNNYLLNKYVFN